MSEPGSDQPRGTSIFSWIISNFSKHRTEEEKELRKLEYSRRSGRTSPERYKARLYEIAKSVGYAFLLLAVVRFTRNHVFHRHTPQDLWVWIPFFVAPVLQLQVIAIRRLHDVGVSGRWLWRPVSAIKLLREPSGPPNEWGEGPDLISDKGQSQ